MSPDEVTLPGRPVAADESDILGPIQALLTGVNLLGGSSDSTGGAFSTPDQAVAIIESGATALTKWWSGAVAALGGATAITAAATKFWSGQDPATRVGLVAATGVVLAAAAITLAIIISSDLRARAAGATAIYGARAQTAVAFIDAARSVASSSRAVQADGSPSASAQPIGIDGLIWPHRDGQNWPHPGTCL